MNPFIRFGKYFGEKSTKQKILFVIVVLLLSAFVFFFIKGNFFDNRRTSSETSQTYSDSTSQSEDAPQSASEHTAKFHIGFFDIVILLTLISVYVVRLIIKRRNNRRM